MPTFESVREKIETRYGTAIGATELASETPEGRSVEEQYEERQRAAAERLEQIRKSMHSDEGQALVIRFGCEDLGEEGVWSRRRQPPPSEVSHPVACLGRFVDVGGPDCHRCGLPILVPGG